MDLLILTPVEVEYKAVRSCFDHLQKVVKEGNIYETGHFQGKHHLYSIVIRQTGSKNEDISLATERGIRHFQPSMVFLLGICGGVKDVRLGDVVVATKAYGYESTKETDDGPVVRPESLPYDAELIEWARQLAREYNWQSARAVDPSVKVVFAPIASGNKVITSTSSSVYQLLKKFYNDTAAVEMEAIGFSKAAAHYPGIRVMNIRGVSDLLDNKSHSDAGGSQERAIAHALAFTLELLDFLDFSQLKIYTVNAKILAQKLEQLVFPKMKELVTMGEESASHSSQLTETIWEYVKELLTDELAELEDNIDDPEIIEEIQWSVRSKLRQSLKKNEVLHLQMSRLMEAAAQQLRPESVVISNSKNIVQGSTIHAGGNVKIGDEYIGQQINNTGGIKNQVNINENKGDLNFD